jgi:hypothetical protein
MKMIPGPKIAGNYQ